MKRLLDLIAGERKLYAIYVILRWLFEQCFGRFHALLLGWPLSYLGQGSRVLGSKFMFFSGRAHISRYAWIEAVHKFNGCSFKPCICVGRTFGAADRLHISCVNEIRIGDFCLFGSGVYVSDHNHGIYSGENQSCPSDSPIARQLFSSGPVIIGSNVWIGDNVVIVGPVRIGDGVVIGANSVVTSDIPENVIAVGAPAKIIKSFNKMSGQWRSNINAK
jgi:lipopolysaccharide O-acetyltransferase